MKNESNQNIVWNVFYISFESVTVIKTLDIFFLPKNFLYYLKNKESLGRHAWSIYAAFLLPLFHKKVKRNAESNI